MLDMPGQINSPAIQLKHSGLGIASFVISLLNGPLMLGLVIAAGAMVEGGMSENEPGMAVVGLVLIGSIVMSVIGLVLGIVACVQKDRKKLFGIIGLIINGLTVLGIGLIMIIGIAQGA